MTRVVTPATTSVSSSEVITTRIGAPSLLADQDPLRADRQGEERVVDVAENGPASGAQIEMSSSTAVVGVGVAVGTDVFVGVRVALAVGCVVAVEIAVGAAVLVGVGEGEPPPPSSSPSPSSQPKVESSSTMPRVILVRLRRGVSPFILSSLELVRASRRGQGRAARIDVAADEPVDLPGLDVDLEEHADVGA